MDQVPYPGPSVLFHVRMTTLFAILWMVDLVSFALAMDTTLNVGVGGMVLFANEVCSNQI
jgi:E3 ubiquitin-protein ligase synoviolin